MTGERGVSSVVSTVLLVGVVLIMAVTTTVYALNFTDEKREPSPQMHATMDPVSASDGALVVETSGGDPLEMTNLEVVIRSDQAGGQVRLVDLPGSGGSLDASNMEGNTSMVDGSSASGELTAAGGADGMLTAGDRLAVNLTAVDQGDRVTVLIVHTPTNSVIWRSADNATA
ncbi:type IV pilin N-terminal domain-containing protein [Haloarchaeobius sp. TZWWS8]|uniref:type IV pilin N-terminal domain-containing protein n=1 Tax=Haloarchaeobius sp. TZWWS8 TaxID=3446121 RepID=UPI003EC0C1DE